jgi:type III secretory pathway component EscT
MPTVVDELNDFRGTRPAQAICAAIFLGLGLYNLFFESGAFALVLGVLFSVFGLLAVYKLLVGESIVQSISS